jgi:hypothetical protein
LRLEARDYIITALDELDLSVAQGIFSGLNSSAKIFETSSVFLGLFASFFASFELLLQIVFFGKTQCLWKKGRMKIQNRN